jgi:hypothetical protein
MRSADTIKTSLIAVTAMRDIFTVLADLIKSRLFDLMITPVLTLLISVF